MAAPKHFHLHFHFQVLRPESPHAGNAGHLCADGALLMPEKWNWDKYNLMLNIVSKKKKGKIQKLKKIKK